MWEEIPLAEGKGLLICLVIKERKLEENEKDEITWCNMSEFQ